MAPGPQGKGQDQWHKPPGSRFRPSAAGQPNKRGMEGWKSLPPGGRSSPSLQVCRQRRGCCRRDSSIRWSGRRDFWNSEEGLGYSKLYPIYEGTDAGGCPGGPRSHPAEPGQLRAAGPMCPSLTSCETRAMLREPRAALFTLSYGPGVGSPPLPTRTPFFLQDCRFGGGGGEGGEGVGANCSPEPASLPSPLPSSHAKPPGSKKAVGDIAGSHPCKLHPFNKLMKPTPILFSFCR